MSATTDSAATVSVQPRTCVVCGYVTDAESAVDPDTFAGGSPQEGDVAICLGCGRVSQYDASGWASPMTSAEIASLSDDTRAEIDRAESARQRVMRGMVVRYGRIVDGTAR